MSDVPYASALNSFIVYCINACFVSDVKEVYTALVKFEKLSKEVQDILECRIEAVLDEIGSTLLCWLPEDEPAFPDEFNTATEKICQQEAQHLSKYVDRRH